MPEDIESISKEIFDEAGLSLGNRLLDYLYRTGQHSEYVEKVGWSISVSAIFMAKYLERSLKEHARALATATQASEKHAASLTRATWFLGAATIILAIVAIIQLLK